MGLYIGNGITIDGNVDIQFEYASAPTNISIPTITGNTVRNSTLSTTTGSWTGVPLPYGSNFAYQWQRANSNISGATFSTYTLGNADVGQTIRSLIIATTPTGTGHAFSTNTAAILPQLSTAPRNVVAANFNATTIRLTWTAPIDNGGQTPTGYLITANRLDTPGTATATVAGPLSGNISGLVTGGLYEFSVQAINAAGTGAAGDAPNSIYVIPVVGESYGGGIVINATLASAVVAAPYPSGQFYGYYPNAVTFCNNLTSGGYTNWTMPSLTQMQQMNAARSFLGGYAAGYYWTTTNYAPNLNYILEMPTGNIGGGDTSAGGSQVYVRAVRSDFY